MVDIVQKLWNYCNILKDDGMHYGDYIEQLTYLLFLKMADEKGIYIPKEYNWQSLLNYSGTPLLEHYEEGLKELGKNGGVLGDIFAQSVNKFRNPVHLSKLILLINESEWTSIDIDVKGTAYEGLLQKYAAEQKGAGQYFTPRELIRTIVKCVDPKHTETIHDPACGTGGFLIGAFEHIMNKYEKGEIKLTREQWEFLQKEAISGGELVWDTRRLCIMNLYLHEIEAKINFGDALSEKYGNGYDVIVTNPPFGRSGSKVYSRDDFTVQTSNKQLNFLQHCMSILAPNGRCAMVMPDNVLFEEGAGQKIRKILVNNFNLHTVLRLPDGTFNPYAPGVKANVIFFDQVKSENKHVYFYDLRTNIDKINKGRPITPELFDEFLICYQNRESISDRWAKFSLKEIEERNYDLDIFWLEHKNQLGNEIEDSPAILVDQTISILNEALTLLQDLKQSIHE